MAVTDLRPLSVIAALGYGAQSMLNFGTLTLMHVHDGERVPMVERTHHDPTDHDPERGWREGAKIYSCTTCEEEVIVMPPGRDAPENKRP